MSKLIFNVLMLAITSLLLSCQSPQPTEKGTSDNNSPVITEPTKTSQSVCESPRPEMCPQVYEPVCATRDTGVRCVTTPCPSTELVTKSNACTACSDEKVHSYIEGACS